MSCRFQVQDELRVRNVDTIAQAFYTRPRLRAIVPSATHTMNRTHWYYFSGGTTELLDTQ